MLLHVAIAMQLGLSQPLAGGGAATPPAAVDFTRDVAPLLAARCFKCHGPDADSRKAGLRLDKRTGAVEVLASGDAAIVPGKPDESELIARVTTSDADERMPPVDGHAALTDGEVGILRAWIAAGAPYAKHWSWQPLPAVDSDRARAVAAADAPGANVASPLRDVSMPAAMDDAAWLRRVTFDLTGLPPTPAECAVFRAEMAAPAAKANAGDAPAAAAAADAARARVVDALLASPHFGERWARHWLDVVRYAETHGHEFDYTIDEAWRYRDWAIRALNADLPYADFVREQIAGDLLAAPRTNPADGTNESQVATGWWWMSQGTHAPVDVRLDQAERVDNQIDVATKAFLGTTASCARCHDHKFDDVSQRDYYALFGVIKSSRRAYAYQDPGGVIGTAVAGLRAQAGTDGAAQAPAKPAPAGATWTFDRGGFEGWTASGWAFGDAPVAGCANSGALATALQGTLRSPTFTVPAGPIRVRCHGAGTKLRLVIDGFFLDDHNDLLFEGFIRPIDHRDEWRTQSFDARRYTGELAHLEAIDDGDGFIAIDWMALGDVPDAECAPAPVPASTPAPSKPLDIPAPRRVLAMEDGTGMDSPLYARGVPANARDMVPRGMIAGLRSGQQGATDTPANPTPAGSGRLELAEEIVSPNNPLTWRVAANRVWHHMMGRGIVASTDDFGVLGQAPTDAATLDWLALRLRAHGSIKQLVREIALSPVYRSAERPVRRLDGEALRDAVIATADSLDLSMGGPSVPVHLTEAMQGRGRPAKSGPLDGARRRSVYLEIRRNFLSPFLQVFDQPVPTSTVGTRSVSNVPAQTLAMMNDPFVRGQAERWGRITFADMRTPVRERVRTMFERAYARPAADGEVDAAVAFLGDGANPPADAWSDLAHAIFLSTEFRYLR